MLQWPPLVEESRQRVQAVERALAAVAPAGNGGGDSPVAEEDLRALRWAVWTVLSRVLTVLAPDGSVSARAGGGWLSQSPPNAMPTAPSHAHRLIPRGITAPSPILPHPQPCPIPYRAISC